MGKHHFTFGSEHGNRIGEIQFAMFVIGFYLPQRRPKFFQREAVKAGIDFIDIPLLVGEL